MKSMGFGILVTCIVLTNSCSKPGKNGSAIAPDKQGTAYDFRPASITPGVYYLASGLGDGRCLDLDSNNNDDERRVQQMICNASRFQLFTVANTGETDSFTIQAVGAGSSPPKYLGFSYRIDMGIDAQRVKAMAFNPPIPPNVKWTFHQWPDGTIALRNAPSAGCMDRRSQDAEPGGNIQFLDCRNNLYQHWMLQPVQRKDVEDALVTLSEVLKMIERKEKSKHH